MAKPDLSTPEGRARKRVEDFSSLLWHAGAFVVVNSFLWFLDIVGGDGIQWAIWVTIPWAVGLAFHILAYLIDDRGREGRRYEKFLAEEQGRQPLEQ